MDDLSRRPKEAFLPRLADLLEIFRERRSWSYWLVTLVDLKMEAEKSLSRDEATFWLRSPNGFLDRRDEYLLNMIIDC